MLRQLVASFVTVELVLGSVDVIAGWLGVDAPEIQAPNIREVSDRVGSTTPLPAPIASKP